MKNVCFFDPRKIGGGIFLQLWKFKTPTLRKIHCLVNKGKVEEVIKNIIINKKN